ncbi:MAG: hypothetical protein ACLRS8_01040 [Parabacteroides merdae]
MVLSLKEGDYISINGTTGTVYVGKVETKAAELSGDFAELMTLAINIRSYRFARMPILRTMLRSHAISVL